MADLESQDADASIEVKVNDQGPFNTSPPMLRSETRILTLLPI